MTITDLNYQLSIRYKGITLYILNKDKTYNPPNLQSNISIIDALGNEYACSTEFEGFVILKEPIQGAYRPANEYNNSLNLKKFMARALINENL